MIDWPAIDTVLLDMDGTLLDLHFDNYFWQELLPARWGQMNGLGADAAKDRLLPHFRELEGTLSWYCVEHWSAYLDLDILALKSEIEHLIRARPYAEEFLAYVIGLDKTMAMVTNAHSHLIDLKFRYTRLGEYFEHVFCAHHFGVPKEEQCFWALLQERFPFDPQRTLLIDDNTRVLKSAGDYGIRHLLSIAQPDSSMPARQVRGFRALESFRELL